MKPEMYELGYRANLFHKTVDFDGQPKDIIVYEDHRYLLNILDHARRCGVIPSESGVTLVMFDQHDDARETYVPKKRLKAIRRKWPDQKSFWSFVEWELSPKDDDWVIVGMELGLIQNVVLVGARVSHNLDAMTTPLDHGHYKDASGGTHFVANVPHLWYGIGHQGWLVDTARRSRLEPIWKILGWNLHCFDAESAPAPLLLDFCLDCFTYDGPPDRPTRPWAPQDFFEPFERRERGTTAQELLRMIAVSSPFIGICRESPYCGGFAGSDTVLSYLDHMLFEGKLRPTY